MRKGIIVFSMFLLMAGMAAVAGNNVPAADSAAAYRVEIIHCTT